MHGPLEHRISRFALAMSAFAAAAISDHASATTFKTIHTFCAQAACRGGGRSLAGLLMDGSGNLYGTTTLGGKYGHGVVFKLVPDAGRYKEYVLHNFCARANCVDGDAPQGALIMDVDGNLYGTAAAGGSHGRGVVFALTHGSGGWSLDVVKSFCAAAGCADGSEPMTGLSYVGQASGAAWDEFSPLFGTTRHGGVNGKGSVFEILNDGSSWSVETIHSFSGAGPSDTASPGPLLADASGNLFGVTGYNSKFSGGALYRLTSGTWNETTLHNFCNPAIQCSDGATGAGALAMDAAGNLFGTTWYSDCDANSCDGGVAFERAANGSYSVIARLGGAFPSGLVVDAGGDLFGTTSAGGRDDFGTVFRLRDSGGTWNATVLHNFCTRDLSCKDGDAPKAPPVLDADGRLYGTTSGEDSGGAGTVFALTP